ncbi:hypothetical protein [Allorhodopirellula heiligendammensis]|uniref:Uncharacterized protein n=1 Tax=Allorhodopirellula heiligendammensis TaxID=2714739 RepID=A0A5C6BXK2_9BACT|nr:hypothetical protein [Allorhodopirellula heiligendammensis]TWU16201.1 hypothetical protein Poly21_34060 [Allorhodopirellula heiligendammensis]
MIAPMMEPVVDSSPRQHAAEIRREERQPAQRLSRLIEKQPAVVIAAGVVVGLGIGWLVKRKKWTH